MGKTKPSMLINMKRRQILPLAISSIAMLLASCTGPANTESKDPGSDSALDPTSEVEGGERKILEASIKDPVIELDDTTKVVTNVEGCTFHSDDENIAEVDSKGNITGVEVGMARITVSKPGYFDKVLKVFVDEYDTIDYLVEGFEFGPAIVGVKINLENKVKASDLKGVEFNVKTNNSTRTVESVDLCDAEGFVTKDAESNYIRVSLAISSNGYGANSNCSVFTYANNVNDWTKNIRCSVELKSGSSLTLQKHTTFRFPWHFPLLMQRATLSHTLPTLTRTVQ